MLTDEEFNKKIDETEKLLTLTEIDAERDVGFEDEEEGIRSVVLQVYDDVETDFYVGVRNDTHHVDIIWEFDLIPYIVNQLDDNQSEEIMDKIDISYEMSEIEHDRTKRLGLIIKKAEEEGIEVALNEFSLDEDEIDRARGLFDQMYAALLSLDSLNRKQKVKTYLRLEEVFTDHPINYSIRTSSNNGLLGFRLSHRLYLDVRGQARPSPQKFEEIYQTVSNLGEYAEKFLKYTFGVDEETMDEEAMASEGGTSSRPTNVEKSGGPLDPELL